MATPYSSSASFSPEYEEVQERLSTLSVPVSSYLGVVIGRSKTDIFEVGGEHTKAHEIPGTGNDQIISWIRKHAKEHRLKFVAAGIVSKDRKEELASRLWLEEDIVPIVSPSVYKNGDVKNVAKSIRGMFDAQDIAKVPVSDDNEVSPSFLVSKDIYIKNQPASNVNELENLASLFKGKSMVIVNATPRGGGVALMRHALIRLYRLFGVDAHWHVMQENAQVFDITKRKFHNVLQGVADPILQLSERYKEIYNSWTEENYLILREAFSKADVVVIDDPQPSGLITHIKKDFPEKPVLYRSHIQVEGPLVDIKGSQQEKVWSFIWESASKADCFIAHPVSRFVPKVVEKSSLVYMPATTDPLDGLNKPLGKREIEYYTKVFNKILLEHGQMPIERDRPIVSQVARFDPSKGIPDAIESFSRVWNMMSKEGRPLPQLVLCGHGSVDDPDGVPMYNMTMELLHSKNYSHIRQDVRVVKLPHIDQLLNTIVRISDVVLQLSHKEGFEVKVTEALMKGKPVVVYKAGGIPLQVSDKESGYVVEKIGDTESVASFVYDLLSDKSLYKKMSKNAKDMARVDVLTMQNAINWLGLSIRAIDKGKVEGEGRHIKDLLSDWFD